jgi:hypothetical protein
MYARNVPIAPLSSQKVNLQEGAEVLLHVVVKQVPAQFDKPAHGLV